MFPCAFTRGCKSNGIFSIIKQYVTFFPKKNLAQLLTIYVESVTD